MAPATRQRAQLSFEFHADALQQRYRDLLAFDPRGALRVAVFQFLIKLVKRGGLRGQWGGRAEKQHKCRNDRIV